MRSAVQAGIMTLFAAFLMGCVDSDRSAGQTPTGPQLSGVTESADDVPTWEELKTGLNMSDGQIDGMSRAHDDWERGEGKPGEQGSAGNSLDGREGMIAFLEESRAILDQEQFVELLGFLGDRPAPEMDQGAGRDGMQGRGGERPPRGEGRPGMGGDRPPRNGQKPQGEMGEWIAALDLSDEQQAALEALQETRHDQMRSLHDDLRAGNLTNEEFREAADALREEGREAFESILTAEQLAQFEEMRTEKELDRIADRLAKLQDADPTRKIEFLTTMLLLDEGQVAEFTTIIEGGQNGQIALLESALAGEISVESLREQSAAARDGIKTSLEAVLSDEQLEIFDLLTKLLHRPKPGREGGGA